MLMAACLSYVAFNLNPRENIYAYNDVGTTNPTVVPPQYVCEHQNICDSLLKAGFNVEQAKIMYAIVGGESNYRQEAVGDTTIQTSKWGPSVTMFQIRTLKAEKDSGSCRDIVALQASLDFSAQCAYLISGQGTNFNPWTAYLNGSYLRYL